MLEEKEIEKTRRDLIELHKRVILTHLVQQSVRVRIRRKLFALYDIYIDTDNIQCYFFRDIKLFIYALVTDRLEEIQDYIPIKTKYVKAKRKKHVN